MTKLFTMLSLALCITVLWASPQAESEKNSQTLKIWSFTDELAKPIERFKELNPGVEVELVVVPNEEYLTKIRPVLKTGKEAPDVFTAEAANVKDIVENGYWDNLGAAPYNADTTEFYQYVVKMGTDTSGILRGLSWQTTPGGIFYRKSIAREYLGTDNPAEIGKMLSTMEGMIKTGRILKEKSGGKIKLIPGVADLMWLPLSQRSNPWVNNKNEFVIDEKIAAYFDIAKQFREENLEGKVPQWAPGWFDGMKKDTSFFAYVLPTWGLSYVLKANAPDSSGDWGLTSGPSNFFWGGTWMGVYKNSKNKELAWKFIKMMTIDHDTLKWWASETGDFLGNKVVVQEIQKNFSEPYLDGQNHYEYFAKTAANIDGKLITKYDLNINTIMGTVINDYIEGGMTLEDALKRFKEEVKNAYPELIIK